MNCPMCGGECRGHGPFAVTNIIPRGGVKWRSIKSVPKDGTRVLLACEEEMHDGWVSFGAWDAELEDWVESEGGDPIRTHYLDAPTHWAPAITPPRG